MSRFREALRAPGLGAVAEIKRRSPSAGDLRPGADPEALASAFQRAGAAAISILVDEAFGGTIEDLRAARRATPLPLLAKGFFRSERQLEDLREAGADAVLLILRDLDDGRATVLQQKARHLGMDALVEAHDRAEVDRAVALDADPIGINARDLGSFAIDRTAQLRLVALAPRDRAVIGESAIEHRAQAAEAELAGADAVLVGSALMREPDPAAKLTDLTARPLVKVCGLTRDEDVAAAAQAGADLAGFILAESPRQVAAALPVPDSMLSVAVHVGESLATGTGLIQVYPEEDGHRARDGVLLREGEPVARILDLPWGAEEPDERHWRRAAIAASRERIVLSGALTPANVADAVATVRPWCVDASRGLESAPGIKDHERIRAFVTAAREQTAGVTA